MTNRVDSKKIWNRPTLVRLGAISAVAGTSGTKGQGMVSMS